MTRFSLRYLLVFAVFWTHVSPSEVSAQEWDPISLSASLGSWKISSVYQGYRCSAVPPLRPEETCEAYVQRLDEWRQTCPSAKDPELEDGGAQCPADQEEGIKTPRRSKSPNAFELEFGNSDVDLTTPLGVQDDLFYVSLGYRRFLAEFFRKERVRIFAGIGAGVYFVEPDEKLGFNLKLGSELAPVERNSKRLYIPIEVAVTYHELDSGFDFTDVTIGVRVHRPNR